MVKKIAIAIWILTASFLGILVVNYVGNRKMIENYGQGVYQQNELGFLGFTQPYINHFNKGNVFYQLGDYQKAKQEYQLALNLRPDEPYDCKIRVNYALSYVTPIDVDDINEDNYKDVIEICETAKSILAENDCATENNDGHYYAAQKLYNEITRYPGDDWKILPTYHQMGLSASKASDCVACRACEKHCPQKLTIADHMKTIANVFEKSEE